MMTHPHDLTNCEREPIHLLGHIQPFGCLLALDSNWTCVLASENCADFIGSEPCAVFGQQASVIFSRDALHSFKSAVHSSRVTGLSERLFSQKISEHIETAFDISVHMSGQYVVLELEHANSQVQNGVVLTARNMISRLGDNEDLSALLNNAAKQIRTMSGYDRVMVYRFLPDESGEVVAESTSAGVDSFLGLRYPASDIPKQARALYKKQLLRIIAGVGQVRVPILSTFGQSDALDLSACVTRAVSPIHLEYLKNMEIEASLSISIMVNGKLWGLFACHHECQRYIPFDLRTLLEFYAEFFSLKLAAREQQEQYQYERNARAIHDQIVANVNVASSSFSWLKSMLPMLNNFIACDGVGLWIGNEYALHGIGLVDEEVKQVTLWLNAHSAKPTYPIENLAELLPNANEFIHPIAGVLAVALSQEPCDYLLFYRLASTQTVTWAGNPEKPVEFGPNGSRLTPRKSFEAWVMSNQNLCEPWGPSDMLAVTSLRTALLELLIRHLHDKESFRKHTQDKQDVLISELNHRVRNILALMRAVVSLTDATASTKDEFKALLDGRVRALAFAHDQLTSSNWSSVALQDVLQNEADAYTNSTEQINMSGQGVNLLPDAVSCIALVMHEMFTNAAKYGSLSASAGKLVITWRLNNEHELVIDWQEKGGPKVSQPKRKGFGSTIIHRSLSHELGGQSSLDFSETGLIGQFVVPARFVQSQQASKGAASAMASQSTLATAPRLSSVLLVEDNLIIALDGEDSLKQLGFTQVFVASSTYSALEILDKHTIDCAILDFNLGTETSLDVAFRLQHQGIPFVFASGYGSELHLPDTLQNIQVLSKPYNVELLKAVVSTF
jgi:light-regulated signal transduction histidine kinase (bacteriophytochrome)